MYLRRFGAGRPAAAALSKILATRWDIVLEANESALERLPCTYVPNALLKIPTMGRQPPLRTCS